MANFLKISSSCENKPDQEIEGENSTDEVNENTESKPVSLIDRSQEGIVQGESI
jgi:hypothetical protein